MALGFSFLPSFFKIDKRKISTDEIEGDNVSLQLMKSYVKNWCIANKFLLATQGGTYVPNITPDAMDNTLRAHIYSVNFKRLCIDANLQELLIQLQDTQHDKTTTRLVDLHILLMTDIDPHFLNLYISKLIYTLETLYPEDVVDHEWTSLFARIPYLWLIYVIQHIMRQAAPNPV